MARLLLVSNRLPVTVRTSSSGKAILDRSSGGLVSALGPIHDAGEGLWIGNPDGELDDGAREALSHGRYVPVHVTQEETDGYYYGYSNSSIWPVFHYLPERASFDRSQFQTYRQINQRFADAVVKVTQPGDTIWIQDYQLMLVPGMIREQVPDAQIGFFLHIPFPSSEMFSLLPERQEILQGLLGANVVGVHTYDYARHFVSSVLRVAGVHMREGAAELGGRRCEIATFPIGIDVDYWQQLAASKESEAHLSQFREHFGDRKIILGVERLDYTKGIPLKLEAFRRLLELQPELRGNVVMIQVVVPSREDIDSYAQQRQEIEQIVGQINGEYGSPGSVPIHYQHQSMAPAELAALYRIADIAFVAPLRDGMNLVAKEFVASQLDRSGTLLLSEFAGAASELGEAVRINPWDVDGTADALANALEMEPSDKTSRIDAMLERLRRNDVHRWATRAIRAIDRPAPSMTTLPPAREPDELLELIKPRLDRAIKPAVLLDYDGTLREFENMPSDATPTSSIVRILENIHADQRVQLALVSGRDAKTLDAWFGHFDITLVAEHGAWMRVGKNAQWIMAESLLDDAWKKQVMGMLDEYTQRTPGSSVEEKTAAVVWHYRAADNDLGKWQARELTTQLEYALANQPVEVIEGSSIVEIRQQGVTKGAAFRALEQTFGPFDFQLAIGDDTTDEDMFAALPESGISIHVGNTPSRASERLSGPPEVRAFLRSLFPPAE
ncbi:MAG: bifunctional alpha,alpha-trehalose-phosphate synthase (UDP-forming)/trehalose-phosphatase [Chloroflexi bacterium]|nr:bifunctional alpha,alpha-trehalose-phosphate synthase (UDP-forming)/trehalose-phosphatase [Chloroflexota bacterium]